MKSVCSPRDNFLPAKKMKDRNAEKSQLCQILMKVPFAAKCDVIQDTPQGFLARYELTDGTAHTLEAVVLPQSYPSVTLRTIQSKDGWQGCPVIISPYISPETVALCAQHGVSCLDLAGNCRICFGMLYIMETGHRNTVVRKPRRPAIFSPTTPISSTILRRMVADVSQPWKLKNLSETLGCSIGLVHKVKTFLCDRLWAESTKDGLKLTNPEGLMKSWAREYATAEPTVRRFQTDLTPDQLEWRINEVRSQTGIRCWFTGASAAAHYSDRPKPATFQGHVYPFRMNDFAQACGLREVKEGGNVVLHLIEQPATLADAVEINGSMLVSPAQMYLDATDDATRSLALKMIQGA